MKFDLCDDQIKKLDEWKSAIKVVFGEYGRFTYKFTPNGIGVEVEVYSELADISLDLTEIDKW
jgi:hypothetical protein